MYVEFKLDFVWITMYVHAMAESMAKILLEIKVDVKICNVIFRSRSSNAFSAVSTEPK